MEYHADGGVFQAVGKFNRRIVMTLCPVALAVGCKKCAIVKFCPGKSIIGDYKKETSPPDAKKK
jgi:hypothetical protein